MWGIIIGIFISLNVISTLIILSACIVSGRQAKKTVAAVDAKMSEQMELATAIAKLRHIEQNSLPIRA